MIIVQSVPITDPQAMKEAFRACTSTLDLFRTTFRFAGEHRFELSSPMTLFPLTPPAALEQAARGIFL